MLEEELQDANEQKENTLTKLNELNDEYYKLYEEKKNIELNISIKENEENQKQKLNNELLSDEINNLNDKIKYLNKQIKSYEEKVNNLSKKNKEEAENISQMKKELVCKDEVIKMTIEKFNKLNEEKEKIRLNNRELERSIEDFKNQCKDYQIIINYSNEQIKELKEKLNKQEQTNEGRKISLNSLLEDEEEKEKAREREAQISDLNNINNDINENINLEEIKELRRNAVDYTGKEINLNELIFEESESAEHEAVEKKNKIKLAFTRVKNVRRFNKLKSLNYNYKLLNFGENYEKKHKSRKNVRFNELSNINELNEFNRDFNGRLKTIKHQKSNLSNTKILYKMMNSKSQCNYVENDEKFLYELLFNSIDL
jgi:chromosome segregation ATPase